MAEHLSSNRNTNMKPLCIYHGNCADGFTAAWVVNRFFNGEVDLHAGVYQTPPPDTTGRYVILVDFSYKRPVLLELAKRSEGVLVLDHHKSAAEDLAGNDSDFTDFRAYEGLKSWQRFLENCGQDRMENIPVGRIYTYFDMERSGAGLAWDFFFPDTPRPALINHVEDRDLWRFAIPGTREVQANIFSHPYDLNVWDALMLADPSKLIDEGRAIERKHFKDVNELIGVVTRRMVIGGHNVPIANLPYIHVSDAAHALAAKGEPFAGCYWDTPKGRVFGLRSTDAGVDVSEVAKQYGGGGHRNAAGFTVSYETARGFEVAP